VAVGGRLDHLEEAPLAGRGVAARRLLLLQLGGGGGACGAVAAQQVPQRVVGASGPDLPDGCGLAV